MLNYRTRKISHRFYDEIVKVMLLLWSLKSQSQTLNVVSKCYAN
ncbi:hypothetical protein JCM19239_7881 [Vibrio variabilis]|uniref:Uncharacterized protein n=1 Tax=Vibrio variabilis TaxID=990271 RepID=A0ABQ0JLI4_9VIBR|nr:hypothetical protein JCM19239_7881 [Vibrio variabilis]